MKTAGKFFAALLVCGVMTFGAASDKVEAAETNSVQTESVAEMTEELSSSDDVQLLYGPPPRPHRGPHYGPPPPPHRPHYGSPPRRPGPPPPPPHRRPGPRR